jgi:glycosyltransferase involved in cell wall biosynthesis
MSFAPPDTNLLTSAWPLECHAALDRPGRRIGLVLDRLAAGDCHALPADANFLAASLLPADRAAYDRVDLGELCQLSARMPVFCPYYDLGQLPGTFATPSRRDAVRIVAGYTDELLTVGNSSAGLIPGGFPGRRHMSASLVEAGSFFVSPRRREKIRVGFLTPTLLFGGAERWVAALANGLDPERFLVTGIGVCNPGEVFPAIAQSISCPILEGPQHFRDLADQSDIVVTWGLSDLSALTGYAGRVVVVSHGHCNWTTEIVRGCLPHATDWAAVSQRARNSFPDPGKVFVLHNGIDTERCKAGRERDAVRADWGLRPEEIAVGYVGRMSPEKNPLAAVQAARHLGKPYRAVLIGDGWKQAETLAAARKIDPTVIHQPAIDAVGEAYRAIDCMVLASPSEGFSLSLTEAWYCGCPTVSTPVGATELTELHGRLTEPVPVGASPEVLAAAVVRAIGPANRRVIEHAARVVSDRYTAEAMCQRWGDYLETIVGTSTR